MCENAHFLVLRSPPLAQYEPDRRTTSQSSSPIYVARIALIKRWGHLVRFRHTSQFRQNGCFWPNTLNRRWSPPRLVVRRCFTTNRKQTPVLLSKTKFSVCHPLHVLRAPQRRPEIFRPAGLAGLNCFPSSVESTFENICSIGSTVRCLRCGTRCMHVVPQERLFKLEGTSGGIP